MKTQVVLLISLYMSFALYAQVNPAFPDTHDVVTCFPDTTGYDVITVGPVDRDYTDLQEAINASSLGTVILLDASIAFYGGFQLPDKGAGDAWIILMTSRMDLMPADETRIDPETPTGNIDFPTQRDAMPKIITNHLSGIPCFTTEAMAHHYRLVGLEITVDENVLNSYGLVNLGTSAAAQHMLSEVPHHFVIDRCYIHGHTQATVMKYGVRLDCANGAIIDSDISDFHSIGFDAQAISGINGPGPFKILNNYLEASGENILFGGGAPAIPGLVPSDIEIRQNYFYKPWSWRVGHPSYSGKHWTIKNLFELKTGRRVWIDGNIMENCWADLPTGQSGYAILLTVRTEGGASPQADVSDIIISNNIIRHVGAGITLSGTDGGDGNRSSRIRICNNLFEDIDGPAYGDLNTAGPNDGTFLKIGEPQDVWIDHNTILQSGPVTWAYDVTDGFMYTNNISHCYISAGGYQGIYGPGQSQGNNTITNYFPDITDANMHFHHNVLIGGNASRYNNFNTISQNYFPPDITSTGFINYANGKLNYRLYALDDTSPYAGIAIDGSDPGVNFDTLDSAFARERGCPDVISAIEPDSKQTDIYTNTIYPNPAHDRLFLDGFHSGCTSYSIHDMNGRMIISSRCQAGIAEISLRQIASGMYILRLYTQKTIQNYFFVRAA